MDSILIRDLAIFYRVGVTEEERAQPQRLLLSVELGSEFSPAAATDDLMDTIDYYAVSRRLLGFGDGKEWKLIEKMAVEIAEMVLAEFAPCTVSVEVKKFVLPEARFVSVRVTRDRTKE